MADAKLTINSRNYGAWSLRGWLLCKLADSTWRWRSFRATIRRVAPS